MKKTILFTLLLGILTSCSTTNSSTSDTITNSAMINNSPNNDTISVNSDTKPNTIKAQDYKEKGNNWKQDSKTRAS